MKPSFSSILLETLLLALSVLFFGAALYSVAARLS